VAQAFATASQLSGIDFAAQAPRVRIIEEEYGRETIRITHYWRGPHTTAGSAPGIRLDITRGELVVFEPTQRKVFHPFSDVEELGPLEIRCYALEEMMAEKVRAVLGQRIFAVSRNLLDIFSLLGHVEETRVLDGLPKKLDSKGVVVEETSSQRLIDRREEFRADWERNLVHLLPPRAERRFDEVWEAVVGFVTRAVAVLKRAPVALSPFVASARPPDRGA